MCVCDLGVLKCVEAEVAVKLMIQREPSASLNPRPHMDIEF